MVVEGVGARRVHEAALRMGWSRTVESSRRDVYEALARLASGSLEAEASYTDLAVASCRSRPVAVKAVRDLIGAGLIVHHAPIKEPKCQKPSRYELL